MYIKDTWLLVRYTKDKKKVLVNLYWLLKERYFLLMISDIQLPREMELSNGNIIISDGTGLDIIDCTKHPNSVTRLDFTGIGVIIGVSNNWYMTWRYDTIKTDWSTAISTDIDSEVNKLNSRMSLIGVDNNACTDGVQIIERANVIKNKGYIKQNTVYTIVCDTKEDVRCQVTDDGFVNLNFVQCYTCKLETDGHVNLRYIDGGQYVFVLTDDNVYCNTICRAAITYNMLARTKRIIDCYCVDDSTEDHDVYIDLSKLDLLNKFRIQDKNNTIRSITLDFKDKYVMMEPYAIEHICRGNMDIIIKYSNRKMQTILEVMLEKEENCKIIYTGE